MARIRSIKPEFFADEKLGPLDVLTRFVFVGLICMADDAGRLVDSVRQIDALLFPFTEDSSREPLAKLAGIGRIVRGKTASGQQIIQIANWKTHQRVDHPNFLAALPEIVAPEAVTAIPEALASHSRGIPDQLATRSTIYDLRSTITHVLSDASAADAAGERSPIAKTPGAYPPEFDLTWNAYPTRSGANPKRPAFKAWLARLATGDAVDLLHDGTLRYNAYCVATASVGTRFVMQGSRFFGPDRFFAEAWAAPVAEQSKLYSDVLSDADVAELMR